MLSGAAAALTEAEERQGHCCCCLPGFGARDCRVALEMLLLLGAAPTHASPGSLEHNRDFFSVVRNRIKPPDDVPERTWSVPVIY